MQMSKDLNIILAVILFYAPVMLGLVRMLLNIICLICNIRYCFNNLKDLVWFYHMECRYSRKFKCIGKRQRKFDTFFLSISQSEISHNYNLIFNSLKFRTHHSKRPHLDDLFLKSVFRSNVNPLPVGNRSVFLSLRGKLENFPRFM
jgi:hypothetical protein